MATKAFQQGDVILKLRDALPASCKPVAPGARGFVLAEGEATGHAHTIEATPGVELHEKDGVLWLRVLEEAVPLVHEEHHAQTVAPGVYEVGRVVEMDPFENEVRTVAD
jgi:hypothetical protein